VHISLVNMVIFGVLTSASAGARAAHRHPLDQKLRGEGGFDPSTFTDGAVFHRHGRGGKWFRTPASAWSRRCTTSADKLPFRLDQEQDRGIYTVVIAGVGSRSGFIMAMFLAAPRRGQRDHQGSTIDGASPSTLPTYHHPMLARSSSPPSSCSPISPSSPMTVVALTSAAGRIAWLPHFMSIYFQANRWRSAPQRRDHVPDHLAIIVPYSHSNRRSRNERARFRTRRGAAPAFALRARRQPIVIYGLLAVCALLLRRFRHAGHLVKTMDEIQEQNAVLPQNRPSTPWIKAWARSAPLTCNGLKGYFLNS
jgi:hypothetical protein